jgi:hypothetical protein
MRKLKSLILHEKTKKSNLKRTPKTTKDLQKKPRSLKDPQTAKTTWDALGSPGTSRGLYWRGCVNNEIYLRANSTIHCMVGYFPKFNNN